MGLAGALFLVWGSQGVYKFGASDLSAQSLRPSNLAMWHGIQHLRAMGVRLLDFGRTSLSQEGLRRFKSGWGSAETIVGYRKYNFQARSFVEQEDKAHGRHNAVVRLLPIWVNRQIGSLLYRHIA